MACLPGMRGLISRGPSAADMRHKQEGCRRPSFATGGQSEADEDEYAPSVVAAILRLVPEGQKLAGEQGERRPSGG